MRLKKSLAEERVLMQHRIMYSMKQIDRVTTALRQLLTPGTIVTFSGLLGAGKTTLVQQLCVCLGIKESVVSPTYSYVTTYMVGGMTVYHFDLYRVSGIEEFESLGLADYFNDLKAIVLLEWPDRIASLLERNQYQLRVLPITIKYLSDNEKMREISWVQPSLYVSPQDILREE